LQVLNQSNKLASYVTTTTTTSNNDNNEEGKRGVAVVTGGSSGIGAVTVETLALTGMKVVLCCRNVQDGERVVNGLTTEYGRSNVRVQVLDLADLDSVESCVNSIIEKEGTIDLLLNNAGIMALPQRETTVQNFEKQLGVNHIGHFFLTRKLLPHMNPNGGRVVNVASTAHTMGDLQISNLNFDLDDNDNNNNNNNVRRYTPWGAYGQSKLANILFAKTLNDKLKEEEQQQQQQEGNSGIVSVSLHPGVIITGLWKHSTPSWLKPILNTIVANKSVEQGAATNVYTCLVDASELNGGGGYYSDCTIDQPNANGRNTKLGNQLWTATETMIQDAGYTLPPTLLGGSSTKQTTTNQEAKEEETVVN